MLQSGGFLGRALWPLFEFGVPSMKDVLKTLAYSTLRPLVLTASVADAGIHIKISRTRDEPFGLRIAKKIIWNEEMVDIMKIVQSFGAFGLIIKCVSETIKYEATEQKGGLLSMWCLFIRKFIIGNLLTSKGMKARILGWSVIRAGEKAIRWGQEF